MTVAVSEAAALKIAASVDALTALLTTNQAANVAMVTSTFGVAAAKIPGTIPAVLSAQSGHQLSILKAIGEQTKAINNLSLSVGKVAQGTESVVTAAANIQYTLSQQLTTAQFAAADQIKNNKFQQKTTNASLERAGLPPTEVKAEDMKDAVKQGFEDISVIRAQSTIISYGTATLTEAATEGLKISQAWVAQTAFGKFLTSYTTEAKISAQLIFAEGEAKQKLEEALAAVRDLRQTGGASK